MNLNSIDIKQIRIFGTVAFIFFGCLCTLGIWTNKYIPTYLFGAFSVIGLGFILIPKPMRPVYTAWLKIASFLNMVVTTLILILAYYLVITPSGLIKRLIGGPPLPLKPDKKASSYWVNRTEPSQSKERFIKRY